MKGLVLVTLVILMFCTGCTLLKKNTKSIQQSRLETNEQSYLERVDLKTANKETKIYSYWKDSSLYQYQHIVENTKEAGHSKLNTDNKQVTKQQHQLKKTEPPDRWVNGVIIIALTAVLIFTFRFWFRRII